jgi:hypothetical protein
VRATPAEASTDHLLRRRSTVSTTFPPPDPGRHGWAELLTLVGAIRRLAYSQSLAPDDAMRRIRDAFDIYDGRFADEGG